MGYTHYWRMKNGPIPPDAWAKITADARKLIEAAEAEGIILWHEYDEPGSVPTVNGSEIFFNGAGDAGHETFLLAREGYGFEFCKTACKPYDTVVTAILAVAREHAPAHIRVSSDGDRRDWKEGLAFAWTALGRDVPWPVEGED